VSPSRFLEARRQADYTMLPPLCLRMRKEGNPILSSKSRAIVTVNGGLTVGSFIGGTLFSFWHASNPRSVASVRDKCLGLALL